MPNRTKEMLAESLMKLLARRTLDKITIQDIVDDCGYNRQTFYYHFHDIYDLIDWIFAAQTQELIEKCRACGSLDVGVEAVILYAGKSPPDSQYFAFCERRKAAR